MPYLLVDRIEELEEHAYAVGVRCFSLAEDVFEHHFPGQPGYPGALRIDPTLDASRREPAELLTRGAVIR